MSNTKIEKTLLYKEKFTEFGYELVIEKIEYETRKPPTICISKYYLDKSISDLVKYI